jgi:hypothetical protein
MRLRAAEDRRLITKQIKRNSDVTEKGLLGFAAPERREREGAATPQPEIESIRQRLKLASELEAQAGGEG